MSIHTYLVEAQNGVVKIGSSAAPEVRLATIRLYSPILVRLIAKWPSTRAEEYDLHRLFEKFRSHSEWFLLKGEIASYVNKMRGTGLSQIETWDETLFNRETKKARSSALRSQVMKAKWAKRKKYLKTMATRTHAPS